MNMRGASLPVEWHGKRMCSGTLPQNPSPRCRRWFLSTSWRPRSKQLKSMMEHATQYPEEYSKVASVQKKVRGGGQAAAAGEAGGEVMEAGTGPAARNAFGKGGCIPVGVGVHVADVSAQAGVGQYGR